MRTKIYSAGAAYSNTFTDHGGVMTGALLLKKSPVQPMDASNKQYVDSKFSSLNADNISGGVLPLERIPELIGDVVKQTGSSIINLNVTGVIAGVYSKVTVDSKGRVTNGAFLINADIPSLPWSKIVSGKPITLNGYGITDGVSLSGDTITGFISFNGPITNNTQAATKQYVDTTIVSSNSLSVGDIVIKSYSTTPPGFLRCNGAVVDKTTYADLYAVIGDRFPPPAAISVGSGKPWQRQYSINTTQSADITGWTTGTPLPGVMSYSQAIVTKNRVYLLGGHTGAITISAVYTAPINADGTLGAWTTGTPLPAGMHSSQAIVTKNRVYLISGINNSVISSTVYTAPINADGTLGAWTTSGSLPLALSATSVVVTKNRVYILGGRDGGSASLGVYSAPINADGTLGSWVGTTSLPNLLAYSQAVVIKDRIYLLGGWNGTSTISTVYTAPINADGTLGAWTTGTPLPGVMSYSQAIVTSSGVYMLGGVNGSSAITTVYTAPMAGGLNDYSEYYSSISLSATTFGLPNLSNYEVFDTDSFIKY